MENKIRNAKTDYCDLLGTIAVDFPGTYGKSEFKNYLQSLDVDIKRYDPIGVKVIGYEGFNFKEMKVNIFVRDNNTNKVIEYRNIDTFENLLKHLHRLEVEMFEKQINKEDLEVSEKIDFDN